MVFDKELTSMLGMAQDAGGWFLMVAYYPVIAVYAMPPTYILLKFLVILRALPVGA